MVQDSILPETSSPKEPLIPGVISKEPLSKTKLIVLVKSATVLRATPQNTLDPGDPIFGAGGCVKIMVLPETL